MTIVQDAGLILALASAGAVLVLLGWALPRAIREDTPLYLRKLPGGSYPPEFLADVSRAYEAAGSLQGMLRLLSADWKDGAAGRRTAAALDYLEHSRYKDYETTLLLYLSDGTPKADARMQEILEQEVRKQRGLVCHLLNVPDSGTGKENQMKEDLNNEKK